MLLFLFHPTFDPSANPISPTSRIRPESACSLQCSGYNLVQASPTTWTSTVPFTSSPTPPCYFSSPTSALAVPSAWSTSQLAKPHVSLAESLNPFTSLLKGSFSQCPTVTSIFNIATASPLPSPSWTVPIPLTLPGFFPLFLFP